MLFLRITALESMACALENFKIPAQGHVKARLEYMANLAREITNITNDAREILTFVHVTQLKHASL